MTANQAIPQQQTYLSPQEASQRWGVDEKTITRNCLLGNIPGALRVGKLWRVPEMAGMPTATRLCEEDLQKIVRDVLDEITARMGGTK